MSDATISLQQDVKDLLKYYGKHETTRSDVVIFTETNKISPKAQRLLDVLPVGARLHCDWCPSYPSTGEHLSHCKYYTELDLYPLTRFDLASGPDRCVISMDYTAYEALKSKADLVPQLLEALEFYANSDNWTDEHEAQHPFVEDDTQTLMTNDRIIMSGSDGHGYQLAQQALTAAQAVLGRKG